MNANREQMKVTLRYAKEDECESLRAHETPIKLHDILTPTRYNFLIIDFSHLRPWFRVP